MIMICINHNPKELNKFTQVCPWSVANRDLSAESKYHSIRLGILSKFDSAT